MRAMVPLRIAALCSNVAFLIYALSLHLVPIFVLHLGLLVINAWRLRQSISRRKTRWLPTSRATVPVALILAIAFRASDNSAVEAVEVRTVRYVIDLTDVIEWQQA